MIKKLIVWQQHSEVSVERGQEVDAIIPVPWARHIVIPIKTYELLSFDVNLIAAQTYWQRSQRVLVCLVFCSIIFVKDSILSNCAKQVECAQHIYEPWPEEGVFQLVLVLWPELVNKRVYEISLIDTWVFALIQNETEL